MRDDKLVINTQSYNINQLDRLPDFVQAQAHQVKQHKVISQACKKTDHVTLFFTKESPLSNFHPSPFELNGRTFNCVEQYLGHEKALLFNAREVAQKILLLDKPHIQKQKARNLDGHTKEKWKTRAAEILKPAIYANFTQNEDLITLAKPIRQMQCSE